MNQDMKNQSMFSEGWSGLCKPARGPYFVMVSVTYAISLYHPLKDDVRYTARGWIVQERPPGEQICSIHKNGNLEHRSIMTNGRPSPPGSRTATFCAKAL